MPPVVSAQRGLKRSREAEELPEALGAAVPPREQQTAAVRTEHDRRSDSDSRAAAKSSEAVLQPQDQVECIDLLGSSDDEQTEVGPLSARQGGAATTSTQQTASHHSSPAENWFSGIVQLSSLAEQISQHTVYPMQVKVHLVAFNSTAVHCLPVPSRVCRLIRSKVYQHG